MRYISECGDPVQHRVSFGMPQTLAIGYSNLFSGMGLDYPAILKKMEDNRIPMGLIRISAGRDRNKDVLKEVIREAIDYAYDR
jgi:hypothetical protein